MKYEVVMERLRGYSIPGDWPPSIFLLPDGAMKDIYDCIVSNRLEHCIELGTGHGATSCVMAAALEEVGSGSVLTIDKTLHEPVNAHVLQKHTGLAGNLDFVVEPLGYNWHLADLIAKRTTNGTCEPFFDLCLIDGAHEFEPDALAFTLVAKLLKPGGWIVLDDLNFQLRSMSFWQTTHGHLSDRELDTCQIGMVYDYLVKQHPQFEDFRVTEGGRVGWARKIGRVSNNSKSTRSPGVRGSFAQPDQQPTSQELRTQLIEKQHEIDRLRAHISRREARLAQNNRGILRRLLDIYGRRIKYPYLLPFYRLLGLMPAKVSSKVEEACSRRDSK